MKSCLFYSKNHKNLLNVIYVLFTALALSIFILKGGTSLLLLLAPLILWGWVKLIKQNCAAACLILVIFSEGLYRIYSFGLGDRRIGDIAFVLIGIGILFNFRIIWKHITNNRSPYTIGILLFWLAVILSIYFGSHVIFQQPLVYGFIPARKYFYIGVFFLLLGTGAKTNDLQKFFRYLAWWGAILAILGIIDASLGSGIIFQEYHQIGNMRGGEIRLAVGTFNVCFSIIYATGQLLHKSKTKYLYGTILLLCLFNLFFVSMTRAAIIGIALTTMIMVSQLKMRTLLFLLIGLGILLPIGGLTLPLLTNLKSTTHIVELTNSIDTDIHRDKGNVAIRKRGARILFETYWNDSPLVGMGLFSDDRFPNNPIAILSHKYNYHLIDVNGIATLIKFGIPGIFLLIFFIVHTFIDSYKLSCNQHQEKMFIGQIIFALLLYVLFTPTLGNILVERMLIYTGIICYTLDLYSNRLKSEK